MKFIKSKKRIATALLLAGAMSVGSLAVINAVGAGSPYELTFVDGIEEYYEYNAPFEVPEADFTNGSQSIDAQYIVYDPDQEVIRESSFVLDKRGEYRISYSATVEGKFLHETKTFQSATLSKNVLEVGNNAYLTGGVSAPDYLNSDAKGVKVTATADGGYVRYSKTLDLRYNTQDDLLLSYAVIPEEKGTEDCWQVTITLTDIYDSTNTLRIATYRGSWSNNYCFTRAATKGQQLAGLQTDNASGEIVAKTEYRMGAGVSHSFVGNNVAGADRINYYWDNEERALYVSPSSDKKTGGKVMDFDDPDYIAERLLWGGFTTGEVTMTVALEKLKTTEASILVYNVNGNDLGDIMLSGDGAPDLRVDYGKYSKNDLPKGAVGMNYPLFPVFAYDKTDGALAYVDTKVYFEGGEDEEVAVQNGAFLPRKAGNYRVVHTCLDENGNQGSLAYRVQVAENLPALSLKEDYAVANACYRGEYLSLPDFEVVGGAGTVEVNWVVQDGEGKVLAENARKVYCGNEGEYTVTVCATDYLEQTFEKIYTVSVSIKLAPIIEVDFMPSYLVVGKKYVFADFSAIDYTGEKPVQATKKIVIEYAGNTTTLTDSYEYTPTLVDNETSLTVKLYATNVDGEHSDYEEYTVQLIDGMVGKKVNYASFFKTEGLTATVQSEGVLLSANADGKATYIHSMVANGFEIAFNIPTDKNAFERVNLYLTDSMNEEQSVKLSIVKGKEGEAKSDLYINDGKIRYAIGGTFFGNTKNIFDLSFSMDTLLLKDLSLANSLKTLDQTTYGEPFEGFESRRIYLTVELCGVNGVAGIELYTLGNQTFNASGDDFSSPIFDLTEEMAAKVRFGDTLRVPTAVAADGVDGYVPVYATVLRGKKTLYENVDISKTPIELTVDSYATYKIEYYTYDQSGNSSEKTYSVYPVDGEKPVLSVSWSLTSASVGSTHSLPKATATDNAETVEVHVLVLRPNGEYRAVTEQNITFAESGEYVVRFFVWDTSGNYVYKDYKITVA